VFLFVFIWCFLQVSEKEKKRKRVPQVLAEIRLMALYVAWAALGMIMNCLLIRLFLG